MADPPFMDAATSESLHLELVTLNARSGEPCRGHVVMRFDEPVNVKQVTVGLTVSRSVRQPFSSEPATREIYFQTTVSISEEGSYLHDELPFEVHIPLESELDQLPQPPAFLQRLVRWFDADAIQPMRCEIEVRCARPWKKDLTATLQLPIEFDGGTRRAS